MTNKDPKGNWAVPVTDTEEKRRAQVERRREMLLHLAKQAKELAENLSMNGKPLTEDDQRLIRMAQFPMVQETFKDAALRFMIGEPHEQILGDIAKLFANEL